MPVAGTVIVGAGIGGLRTAEQLRRRGYAEPIVLVGAEDEPPYDRPPMSKDVLTGEREPASTVFRSVDAFAEIDVQPLLGRTATALDTTAREVHLGDGAVLPFDALVIATGAEPRRLPGTGHLAGVHVLRTMGDAERIREAFAGSPRVVVVGGGFIGSEVASSARALGLQTTLIEVLSAPLVRVFGDQVAAEVVRMHREAGVDLRVGVGVQAIEGEGHVEAVLLADGTGVPADVVVVGLGVAPATDWLAGSGVEIDNGVRCDEYCESSVPGIYAVGDVARWPHPRYGSLRIEHWTNAGEQGAAVGAAIADRSRREPFAPVPYVWSDQHGVKIQVFGIPDPAADVTVTRAGPAGDRLLAVYGRDGVGLAAVGFGVPARLMKLRKVLAAGASYDDLVSAATGGS